jgi:uncharacterized membrane protein
MRMVGRMLGHTGEPHPEDTAERIDHSGVAAMRLGLAGVAGIGLAAGLAAGGAYWAVAAAGGWDAAAFMFLAFVAIAVYPKDAEETRMLAQAEDFSRPVADLVLLSASVASLGAVASVLVRAGHSGSDRWLLIALAVVTVALGWLSVHTVYMLRYAQLYYYDLPIGGIDFNETARPDYHDFAYLAVTIGMTYQVSDTTLKTQKIRHTALRHALLSYLFGTVIVAVTINVVASLLNK